MPSLEIVSPVEDEVVASYSFDTEPGATVSVSGFHGTQTYTLSNHDQALLVRFTGVTDFVVSGGADPQAMKKQRAAVPEGSDEEGAEESDAEYRQRTNAEAIAAANDKKSDKKVTLIDDQGTARTYVMVEEEAAQKKAAPAPAAHKEPEKK